jgi:hypothetical protein
MDLINNIKTQQDASIETYKKTIYIFQSDTDMQYNAQT